MLVGPIDSRRQSELYNTPHTLQQPSNRESDRIIPKAHSDTEDGSPFSSVAASASTPISSIFDDGVCDPLAVHQELSVQKQYLESADGTPGQDEQCHLTTRIESCSPQEDYADMMVTTYLPGQQACLPPGSLTPTAQTGQALTGSLQACESNEQIRNGSRRHQTVYTSKHECGLGSGCYKAARLSVAVVKAAWGPWSQGKYCQLINKACRIVSPQNLTLDIYWEALEIALEAYWELVKDTQEAKEDPRLADVVLAAVFFLPCLEAKLKPNLNTWRYHVQEAVHLVNGGRPDQPRAEAAGFSVTIVSAVGDSWPQGKYRQLIRKACLIVSYQDLTPDIYWEALETHWEVVKDTREAKGDPRLADVVLAMVLLLPCLEAKLKPNLNRWRYLVQEAVHLVNVRRPDQLITEVGYCMFTAAMRQMAGQIYYTVETGDLSMISIPWETCNEGQADDDIATSCRNICKAAIELHGRGAIAPLSEPLMEECEGILRDSCEWETKANESVRYGIQRFSTGGLPETTYIYRDEQAVIIWNKMRVARIILHRLTLPGGDRFLETGNYLEPSMESDVLDIISGIFFILSWRAPRSSPIDAMIANLHVTAKSILE